MRKTLIFAFILLFASTSFAYASPKIAICDLQKIADQSQALKDAFDTLDKALTPEKNRLEKERKELEGLSQVLQNPSASQKERQDFMDRQAKYMESTGELINNVKESEIQVRIEMDNIIMQAAEAYAKKNKYDMVLDTQSVLYQNKSTIKATDITKEMVSEVNRLWKEAKK